MTVDQGMQGGGGGGDKFPVQTSFAAVNTSPATSTYHTYPPQLATYEDVVASRDLFMDTLRKLHVCMGTKFMNPIVGGRDLDLHRLFVEVTSRGGIAKVMKDRRWKEVTAAFSFPSSATNASFILRKYYVSLLYHYEQIYFFKAMCWTPAPADAMLNLSATTGPPHVLSAHVPPVTQRTHAASAQQTANAETSTREVSLTASAGSPVCGVIDGKFDSGYLVTVKIGLEEFKGVLYQVPNSETQVFPDQHGGMFQTGYMNPPSMRPGMARRKRRKKSEIRRRDPEHPKPNRSGYNFFFAEQHARLKPHYHGKDREISRIIGESWNKLQEPERAVYQEKALEDKERYKREMEVYRERLRTGQVGGSALRLQQRLLLPEGSLTEMSSDKSDNLEGYESAADRNSDFEGCSQADTGLKNVDIEVAVDEVFDLQTRPGDVGQDQKDPGHSTTHENRMLSSGNNDMVLVGDGISVPIEGIAHPPSNASESVPNV